MDMKSYEGMFLVDSGLGEFQVASEPVRNILERYGAEVLSLKAWDERRLAYEVLGRKRGLYILSYFKADPLKIREIENDCQLDERVLRALVLRRDRLTPEVINADTPATAPRMEPEGGEGYAPTDRPAEEPAEERA